MGLRGDSVLMNAENQALSHYLHFLSAMYECAYVCVKERERESEREESDKVCDERLVCVCLCLCVCVAICDGSSIVCV